MLNNYIEQIKSKINIYPTIGLVLGSGLGNFVDSIQNKEVIFYNEINGYPLSTVKGHDGKFVLGTIENKNVICAQGRFHLYEGYDRSKTELPIDIFKKLGCNTSIITNAAGCMNESWKLGEFMFINKCMDFTFLKKNYVIINDKLVNAKVKSIYEDLKNYYSIYQGAYSWVTGPTYETPSEIKIIKKMGGDVIGMSTLPELIKAYEYGMNVIGISCLSNYASGISNEQLTHNDVLNVVSKSNKNFSNLLFDIIKLI